MQMKNYTKRRDTGHARLEHKGNGEFEVVSKRFCPEMGSELKPEYTACNKAGVARMIGEVENTIANLEGALDEKRKELDALKALGSDIDAALAAEKKAAE